MDRNTIVGFSLIFLILVGYYWITAPSEAELALQRRQLDSVEKVETAKLAAFKADSMAKAAKQDTTTSQNTKDTSKLANLVGGFASQFGGKAEYVTLKNDAITARFSTKGGRPAEVRLNNFKRADSTPLILIAENSSEFYYEIATQNDVLKTDDYNWTVANKTDNSVSFRLNNGKGGYIEQVYTLNQQNFVIDYQLKVNGIQQDIRRGNSDFRLNWRALLHKQEKDLKWEAQNSTVVYRLPGEHPESLSATSPEKEDKIQNNIQWVAFKQQYFNATIINKDGFDKGSQLGWSETRVKNKVKDMQASLFLDYGLEGEKEWKMTFYFGPNRYKTLSNLKLDAKDHELQRMIPLGWGIFGWVNRWVVIPVFNFLDGKVASMGITILLLTLIIKFLLLPLVYKSYISTAKMRILKPEMDEIKEKHGNDMQKLQVENMALYKKAGVNPMSGCVPMLLQMPILFAMFQFFPVLFELRQKSFLWSHDLSRYDSILDLGFTIPFYGDHVSLFTLLMTISTLIYTHLNNQISGVTGQMKWIGYLMPVIFLGVLNDYSSGLTWYYFVSNMVTFGQQFVIRRLVDDKKLHAQISEAKKKPVQKSNFQKRLEGVMQAQQQKTAQAAAKKPAPKKKK
jgi:YidC/Oxa1 family membrane protein insertase